MTTFDEREDTFEKKFALDEELHFKATARRNRLLAHWAAEQMGMQGEAADDYARAFVVSNLQSKDNEIAGKIAAALKGSGITAQEEDIRSRMILLWEDATAAILAGQ